MMDRRHVLSFGAAFTAASLLPHEGWAQSAFAPRPGDWKTHEIKTRVELASGASQAWIPVPAVNEAEWFRSLPSTWTTSGVEAALKTDPRYGSSFLHVVFPDSVQAPVIEVTSRIQTRDRMVDLSRPDPNAAPLPPGERGLYLEATDLIPVDGIVKETSDRITAGHFGEVEKARAIYEWVVENTFRNAATRGCGIGDIAAMLRSGNLGGKCADLNALFVGLARAAGLPARDVYGLRVAPSRFGYKSLGANTEVVTKSQHCRAEVHLAGFGWVPVDPADVRKVALEEPPGKLTLQDEKVLAARKALFGSWEGNWLAYNFAHDVALPGAAGPKVEFLMYPQAEIRNARIDCLDPDNFRYAIRAAEIAV
jgi:transglutaminase-like putative cysteine protease